MAAASFLIAAGVWFWEPQACARLTDAIGDANYASCVDRQQTKRTIASIANIFALLLLVGACIVWQRDSRQRDLS